MPKLLLVEDDVFLADAFLFKVANHNYEVKTATNGIEASQVLKDFQPDLIILDLVMPQQDGLSFLKELKQNEAHKDIPVIVASNIDNKDKIKQAKELGAVDYYVKSNISIRDLLAKCKKILE